MTYLLSFFALAHGAISPVTVTVHGSLQSCEAAKAKLMKEVPKELRLTAVCLDR